MAAEGFFAKVGAIAGVVGALFAAVALPIGYMSLAATVHWPPFDNDIGQSTGTNQNTCVSPIIESRADSPDRLRPPKNLSITWDRSPTVSGRVSATIHWQNVDPRTAFGLIEVTGRFGSRAGNDIPYILDGRELPAEGLCGHWLRRYSQADDDERGVFFDGLWVGEPYCFAVNSSDPGGGVDAPYPSIKTPPVCEKAPWNEAWGQPANPQQT